MTNDDPKPSKIEATARRILSPSNAADRELMWTVIAAFVLGALLF